MEKLGWKGRIAVVLSALWLLLLYAATPASDAAKTVAGFGLLPLGLLWGIAWAFQGYRRQHSHIEDPAAPARRKGLVLRFLLGLGILGAGIWYAQNLMGDGVYQEAGYWGVFALICWAALRSLPKISKYAMLLTVTAYASTLCVQAYRSHLEVQEIKREIAAASPFLLRLNAGEVISEGEIARASLGRWEPLIRTSSKYVQEQAGLIGKYSSEVAAIEFEKLLEPRVIGSSQGRQIARQRLQQYDQALDKLDGGIKQGWQRHLNQIAVISAQIPAGMASGLKKGMEERYERSRPLLAGWLTSQRNVLVHTRTLINFVESLGPKATVMQTPPTLIFADASDLAHYRSLVNQFSTLASEEEIWKKRMLDDERQSSQKLVDFVQTTAR